MESCDYATLYINHFPTDGSWQVHTTCIIWKEIGTINAKSALLLGTIMPQQQQQEETTQSDTERSDSSESEEHQIEDTQPEQDVDTDYSVEADIEKRLYIVNFDDEAERKRVDSAIESWSGGDGGRPSGAIRVAEGENHDELLDILTARVPVDHIECYKMAQVEVDDPTVVETIERELSDSKESVDSMVNFIISNHRGNMTDPRGTLELEPEAENLEDVPIYRIGNKKGTVKVSYTVEDTADGCRVFMGLKGHHIPVEYVKDEITKDLDRYERSTEQQGGNQ